MTGQTHILLAHGGGGRLSHQLVQDIFAPAFAGRHTDTAGDGAVVPVEGDNIIITTDTFVVKPLVFPGGDIGKLAVCGTVNDLAMCGAAPQYLSAGFVLEEGLGISLLSRIVESMADTAHQLGVEIVTGDTKVVERGRADGMYINTTGIGCLDGTRPFGPSRVRKGDAVIVSGDLGRHGIAVMAFREGLEFETTIESDCASLAGLVRGLIDDGVDIHCLRDLTRGGLASALVEIAAAAGLGITVRESDIPVSEDVAGACELLGLDPLYVANEGRLVAFVPADQAEKALESLRREDLGRSAVIIGEVNDKEPEPVVMETISGTNRPIEMFSGEQLPRIC